MQELFSRLGQDDFFTQPVQKATADIVLQRLHGVAYGRLGKVQFPRGLCETIRACQGAKRPKLPAVEGRIHP